MNASLTRRNSLCVVVAIGAAGIAAATVAVSSPASAAPTGSTANTADIRSAHFSPDAPGVDVYLTAFSGGKSTLWVPDEKYGGVSKYTQVPAGQYVVSMRKHGSAMSDRPILSWNLNAVAGRAYTAAAVGTASKLTGTVLRDDLTPPAAGKGRVRLIQAASRAPKANVVATNGPVIAQNATFASSTGYAEVPAGTWPLSAKATAGNLTASAPVSVRAGSVTSVLLLDSQGKQGITLTSVLDSASAGTMPKGAVPAGGGGEAPNAVTASGAARDTTRPVLGITGAVALLALGLAFALAPRRRVAKHAVK